MIDKKLCTCTNKTTILWPHMPKVPGSHPGTVKTYPSAKRILGYVLPCPMYPEICLDYSYGESIWRCLAGVLFGGYTGPIIDYSEDH